MKISYRREMKHNYLMIEPEDLAWRGYEYQMILENTIEGLLPFSMMQTDEQVRFYYEITSRQPLSRLLEGRTISGEEIRKLILGIANTLNHLERYLLPEHSILLQPEYIYVEPEDFRCWLCMVPGLDRDFLSDYSKMLEYLLGKVDHQDKESVVLAYGLYQETRKENYGLEDMLALLKGKERTETTPVPVILPEPVVKKTVYEEAQAKPYNWREKTKYWFGKNKKSDIKKEETVPWKMVISEESPVFHEVISAPEARDTVLLSEVKNEQIENIQWLRSTSDETEDIAILYYPFIIGKQPNLVDYLLDKDTVSRLHLRLEKEGDRYQITDLNSTNGTSVRETLLENNETEYLYPGDRVRISRYEYWFDA